MKIELEAKMFGTGSVDTVLGCSFGLSAGLVGNSGQSIGAPRQPKPTLKITDLTIKKV